LTDLLGNGTTRMVRTNRSRAALRAAPVVSIQTPPIGAPIIASSTRRRDAQINNLSLAPPGPSHRPSSGLAEPLVVSIDLREIRFAS
jgi:hypothetical protein